jgi:hypothetical protein
MSRNKRFYLAFGFERAGSSSRSGNDGLRLKRQAGPDSPDSPGNPDNPDNPASQVLEM